VTDFINTSSTIGAVYQNLILYVFGDQLIAGLWLLLLFFGMLTALNINWVIGVAALTPLTIGLLAYGYISPLAGGLILLASAFILGMNFFIRR
jgi:hypothetical protein